MSDPISGCKRGQMCAPGSVCGGAEVGVWDQDATWEQARRERADRSKQKKS